MRRWSVVGGLAAPPPQAPAPLCCCARVPAPRPSNLCRPVQIKEETTQEDAVQEAIEGLQTNFSQFGTEPSHSFNNPFNFPSFATLQRPPEVCPLDRPRRGGPRGGGRARSQETRGRGGRRLARAPPPISPPSTPTREGHVLPEAPPPHRQTTDSHAIEPLRSTSPGAWH